MATDREAAWKALTERAETILAGCGRDMQSLAAAAMVFPSHLGRLRRLAEDIASAHDVPLAEVDVQVKVYEDRLAMMCGL